MSAGDLCEKLGNRSDNEAAEVGYIALPSGASSDVTMRQEIVALITRRVLKPSPFAIKMLTWTVRREAKV